jgi:acyl carrier protein
MMTLEHLLRQHFPGVVFDDSDDLRVGSLPDWTSLAHFNFLLLVEESYGVRFSVDEMSDLKSIADIRAKLARSGIAA